MTLLKGNSLKMNGSTFDESYGFVILKNNAAIDGFI